MAGDLPRFTEAFSQQQRWSPGRSLLTAVEELFQVEAPLGDRDCSTGPRENPWEARFPLGFARTGRPCGAPEDAERPSEKERGVEVGVSCVWIIPCLWCYRELGLYVPFILALWLCPLPRAEGRPAPSVCICARYRTELSPVWPRGPVNGEAGCQGGRGKAEG